MLIALAWVVTLVAFFVLAIMLFLAVVESKLTTLKGFILVPFALWRGTSSIAEPVLGQIITSGVRILVFAVVTGIGTQIFTQILPSEPSALLGDERHGCWKIAPRDKPHRIGRRYLDEP
jgi:type IV secretion system protein TrbL